MSRNPIGADDPDLGHLAGGVIVEGADRVTVERIIDAAEPDPNGALKALAEVTPPGLLWSKAPGKPAQVYRAPELGQ